TSRSGRPVSSRNRTASRLYCSSNFRRAFPIGHLPPNYGLGIRCPPNRGRSSPCRLCRPYRLLPPSTVFYRLLPPSTALYRPLPPSFPPTPHPAPPGPPGPASAAPAPSPRTTPHTRRRTAREPTDTGGR